MGIQDRDYYREGPSFLDRVGAQGATVWLIAITCGIFFGQHVPGSPLTRLGEYDTHLIRDGEVWRLFTAMFLHDGPFHLFFNMLFLYMAGRRLEELYGSREFAMFYLVSGVVANLIYFTVQMAALAAPSTAIGASGAVMATLIVFACHFPMQRVLFFFVVPMPVWVMVVLFVLWDLVGATGGRPGSNIGFLVHLGGAFFGFMYFRTGIQLSAFLKRSERARVRPKLRVHAPSVEEVEEDNTPEPVGAPVEAPARPAAAADEQLEAKLDAVLEKVSKHGQESLTAEEREILFKASELYKKRRK